MSNPIAGTAKSLPEDAPPAFHLLAKPSGSTCNIDCTYCFFLSKDALYPNERHRMSAATLEAYIRQLLESHRTPQVTVAWQGGEPTLMRLEFFRHSVELVEKYRRPGQVVQHTFQTNGILLDDEWCAFFRKHAFLVGLSVDGPRELHDTYRVDRRKRGTFDRVMQGWKLQRHHEVKFNILCTVNAANQKHGRRVTGSSATSWVPSGCSSSPSSREPPSRRCNLPTRAGVRIRAANVCSTRRRAIWSLSARSARSNTADFSSMSSRNGCATM